MIGHEVRPDRRPAAAASACEAYRQSGDPPGGPAAPLSVPMTVYVDTSALLRMVLRGTGSLDDLRRQDALISRELVVVESVRTVDRLRLLGRLTTEEAADRLRSLHDWLEALDLVLLRPAVLRRAGEPMPTPIGNPGSDSPGVRAPLARAPRSDHRDCDAGCGAGTRGPVIRVRRAGCLRGSLRLRTFPPGGH